MKSMNLAVVCFAVFGFAAVLSTRADIQYAGVNLAGAEFGVSPSQPLPGTFGSAYTYPTQTEVDYFKSRGMNIIRLPFRWERLQHTNHGALDATELGRLQSFVSQTTAKGVYVILDPHNYARYYPDLADYASSAQGLVGSATVPNSDFADFWSRVANIYTTNNHVFFNLMNEPNNMATEQWVSAANAAIAAIRATGATNLILVPGNAWTGAWTWTDNYYGTANAQAMLNIVDPANNFAFDVHQYVDSNGSGGTTNIANGDSMIGATRLAGFTQWCRDNNRKGFLGEFAVGNATIGSGIGDETISNMLTHVRNNADVWLGWTWWAGGPWWSSTMIFMLDSPGAGADRPAMTAIRPFFPLPIPTLLLANGTQFQFPTWPGFRYLPQSSADLTGGVWTDYGSEISGNGQTNTISISVGPDPAAFYRVRVRLGP